MMNMDVIHEKNSTRKLAVTLEDRAVSEHPY